jgi:hypothetical protein
MTSSVGRRRRLNRWMLLGTGVSVVVATVLGLMGIDALRNYTAARTVPTTTTIRPVLALPLTKTALVATLDETNALASLTAFVLRSNGPGGSVLSIPVNGNALGLSGEEPSSFQEVYEAGGETALVDAVQGALALVFDYWLVANDEQAAALFLPVAPLAVTLPADVTATVEGTPRTVLEAGEHDLDVAEIVDVLSTRVSTAPERIRRPNIEAVWAAAATKIGPGIGSAPPTVDSFETLLASLFAGAVGARPLKIDTTLPPDTGTDVENIDLPDAVMVFATIAPTAMAAPMPGKTYRLMSPPGTEAQMREAVFRLLYIGGNVISVSFSGPAQAVTQIFTDGDLDSNELERVSEAFADAEVQAPASPVEGIDVTMILGADFLETALGATTTTTGGSASTPTGPAGTDG